MLKKYFLLCLLPLAFASSLGASERALVFAAASTTAPMETAVKVFAKRTGHKISVSFAGSSVLARQIEAGAPAGMFLSANTGWVDYLEKKGFVLLQSKVAYLGNRLVLATARQGDMIAEKVEIGRLPELLGEGRLAVADPDHVPAGIYSKQALKYFKIWNLLKARLARQINVKATLALIARGEVPYGIVYQTDISLQKKVVAVAVFPENSHLKIIYGLVKVKNAKSPVLDEFYQFLLSVEGRTIFRKYGFRDAGSQEWTPLVGDNG